MRTSHGYLAMFVLMGLMLALPACVPGGRGVEDALAGTRWGLVSYGSPGAETAVIEGTEPSLDFESDNEVTGFTGCNDFAAQYAVTGDAVLFSQIVSTEVFCTGEGVMDQEDAYLEALETAETFERTEDQLRIWYGDGQRVLIFRGPIPAPGQG